MNWLKRRLTFANLIASMALFAALGGVAYAAGGIGGKEIKNHSITGQDIKKGSVPLTALKRLPEGTPGPKGATGAPGAPGSALAYAHVNADGSLDAANSKNIAATKLTAQPGYYCVTPSVPVHGSIANGEGAITGVFYNSSLDDPFTSCPDGATVVEVLRYEGGSPKFGNRAFFITFN